MATRLNVDIRGQILQNAIHGQFDPKRAQLDKDELALSLRIYTQLVSPKHRKVLEEMVELHLPYTHGVGNTIIYCTCSGGYLVSLKCQKPVIAPHGNARFLLVPHPELDKAAIALSRAGQELDVQRKEAWKALFASLNKVTTLERLLEQWPEGKKYYSSPPLKQPITLPAIRFTEINQMLGLA